MPFNRPYSLEEVRRILDASEHRPLPGSADGPAGHAISLHTLERKNVYSRPHLEKDSIFVVSRHSLTEIVHEALNSASGQQALAKLNQRTKKFVTFRAVVLRKGKDLDILTIYRPREQNTQTSFDWLSTRKGDGHIVQVLLKVVKIPNPTTDAIHIQTAFPEEYSRTSGDDILVDKHPSEDSRPV